MSMEKSQELVRRYVEELYNRGDFSSLAELFTPSYVVHDPALPDLPPHGLESLKSRINAYRRAFPDLYVTVEDVVADGDTIAFRWSARGTHRGELFGLAATYKSGHVGGVNVLHLAGGKIQEEWSSWDMLGLLQQLGIVREELREKAA